MTAPVQIVEEKVQRRSLSPRSTDFAALVLIALQVAYFAWSTSTTWFKQDDYAELLLASRSGGFPGTLFHDFNGHIIPGALTLYAVNHKVFGMNWSSVVAIAAIMQFLASYLTWRVLRSFFGVRPLSLLLLLIYVSSLLTFVPLMWFSTLTIYMPLQVALPASLLVLQRFLRNPTKVSAWLPAIVVLIAALFFEKSLFITPLLICFVAVTPITKDAAKRAKDRIIEARKPLLILTTTTSIYGLIYLYLSRSSQERPQFQLSRISDFTLDPIFGVFNPSLTGGPGLLRDPLSGVIHVSGSPSIVEFFASNFMLFAAIVFSAIFLVRWARFWILLYGLALVNVVILVAAGRAWVINNPRNMSEIVFPAVILIGLGLGAGIFEPTPIWKREIPPMVRRRSIQIGAGILFAFGVVVNFSLRASEVRTALSPAPAYDYTNNALSSSRGIGFPVTLIRQYVSGELLNGVLGFGRFHNFTSTILTPANGPWTFADAAIDAYMVLEDGTVVPAGTSHETVPQYENGLCNIDLHDGVPKKLTLNGDPFPWTWYGSLTAATRNDVQITVDWNAEPTTFTIPNGTSTTLFYIPGGGNSMTVTATGGDVCVTDLGFGNLVRDPFR